MKKLKENKWKLLVGILIMLLPSAFGLIVWDKLPDMIATHWNGAGEVDGYSSRAMVVFGLPAILLGCHLLCILGTLADPKNREQTAKALNLIWWICPVVSLIMAAASYGWALGYEFEMTRFMPLFMSLIFIVFGNYMPKVKRNATLGIKLPWTIYNEANWNATHRMAGKLWVIGGVLMLPAVLLPEKLMLPLVIGLVLVLGLVPTVYSYLYYKKQQSSGEYFED